MVFPLSISGFFDQSVGRVVAGVDGNVDGDGDGDILIRAFESSEGGRYIKE